MIVRKYTRGDGTWTIQTRVYDVQAQEWSEWKDIPEAKEISKSVFGGISIETIVSDKGAIDLKMGDRLMPFAGKAVRVTVQPL